MKGYHFRIIDQNGTTVHFDSKDHRKHPFTTASAAHNLGWSQLSDFQNPGNRLSVRLRYQGAKVEVYHAEEEPTV